MKSTSDKYVTFSNKCNKQIRREEKEMGYLLVGIVIIVVVVATSEPIQVY